MEMKRAGTPLGIGLAAVGLAYYIGQMRRPAHAAEGPLPSWGEGPSKRAILGFVQAVTDESAATYVAPRDRIAVFDNDGTLWTEHPLYTQLQFALDRVHALAPEHPEWRDREPFRSILAGDRQALARMSEHDAAAVIAATHSGMTTDDFAQIARHWLDRAEHPRFGRLYKQCVYQPMVELLAHLRANRFRSYIVTGGGVDFMRAVSQELYGIPPAQVIGSSGKTQFEFRGGRSVLVKLPEVSSIDDKQGKPINIHLHIGQRPILAFGNSDGDLQMLQYTDSGTRPRLMLLLHHDDERREYAYDRGTPIGKLNEALDEADERGWIVVSMREEWNRVFVPVVRGPDTTARAPGARPSNASSAAH